jgi:endonuclease-3
VARAEGAAHPGGAARDRRSPRRPASDDALDFLGGLPVREARAWLESITGVGPKTSAAVLLFSRLRRPALPVDSHHIAWPSGSRCCGRRRRGTRARGPRGTAAAEWDAQTVYDNTRR